MYLKGPVFEDMMKMAIFKGISMKLGNRSGPAGEVGNVERGETRSSEQTFSLEDFRLQAHRNNACE